MHGFLLAGCMILFIALVMNVQGETHYVDDGGGAEYTLIQDAVNAAQNGDTIFIYNGTYNESVEFNDLFLEIRGESREGVVIEGWPCDLPFKSRF
jgi:pectin methylesterase-like acyl-CoA thioesterase